MPRLLPSHRGLAVLLALVAATVALAADEAEYPRVTVAAIVATDRNAVVDDKLKAVADEVRKYDPELKGFKLARATSQSVPIGNTETFKLVDDEVLSVKISEVSTKENRYSLVVKPPLVGEITYSTCPDKYFPIVTRYVTKDKERLIIAIMVTGKK